MGKWEVSPKLISQTLRDIAEELELTTELRNIVTQLLECDVINHYSETCCLCHEVQDGRIRRHKLDCPYLLATNLQRDGLLGNS